MVPLLILIPAFAKDADDMGLVLGLAVFKAVVVLGFLLFIGQRMMRPWFQWVAGHKSPELFTLNLLLFTLGLAFLTESAGLSLALGAFLAGMLISETEYRYQVEDDIKPFRDVLLGLFFVTIGMRLDLMQVMLNWGDVLLLVAAIVVGKAVLVAGLAMAFGSARPTAVRTGAGAGAGRRVRLRAAGAGGRPEAAGRRDQPAGAGGDGAVDAARAVPDPPHGHAAPG